MTTNLTSKLLTLIFLFGCVNNTSQAVIDKPEHITSSTILEIIPTDPSYIPNKSQQDSATIFLKNLYKEKQIEFTSSDSIEFVDQGENFDSVFCNLCGYNIEIEDWQNAMDKAYEQHFTDLEFMTPCCHRKTSLNDLTYHSAAGFARFVMAVGDAENELEGSDLSKLQQIVGSKLRVIWAHY